MGVGGKEWSDKKGGKGRKEKGREGGKDCRDRSTYGLIAPLGASPREQGGGIQGSESSLRERNAALAPVHSEGSSWVKFKVTS